MERPHRPRPRLNRSRSRIGFTLIELLVVILIIATLLALLVPAVAGAIKKAHEAQVSAELNNLATALASFKTTYNDYPPSRVLLCEQGYTAFLASTTAANTIPSTGDSNVSDITYGQLALRSSAIMKRFWPRADFTNNPGISAAPGHFNDFNGDGLVDSANMIILNGSEALAFFLGGIPINDGSSTLHDGANHIIGVSGFSRSPTLPFVANLTINGVAIAPNRTTSNYEFVTGRLIDLDGDLIPSYVDPLDVTPGNIRSYAYFSSYSGSGYDPNDVNGFGHSSSVSQNSGTGGSSNFEEEDDSNLNATSQIYVERGFTVSFPPGNVVSPAPNPYTSGVPTGNTPSWINPQSFQIICAGQDRQFGLGGTFVANSVSGTGKLPILPHASDKGTLNNDDTTGVRLRENDNITNFAAGRLD